VLPEQPAGHPANVRAKQGGAQEQRIKVEPYIPVVPGTQIEVSLPGTGELNHLRLHHVMITR
jgi:hypothetical protein